MKGSTFPQINDLTMCSQVESYSSVEIVEQGTIKETGHSSMTAKIGTHKKMKKNSEVY